MQSNMFKSIFTFQLDHQQSNMILNNSLLKSTQLLLLQTYVLFSKLITSKKHKSALLRSVRVHLPSASKIDLSTSNSIKTGPYAGALEFGIMN